MDDRPIGIFDSGFGGLTVVRALVDLVPGEEIVYLGDTGRYPYGTRPLNEVKEFALEIANYLIDSYDVKLLVVACNTASAAALEELEATMTVPVIGVIEPGVRAMVRASASGRVGVIGTVGTIASGAYQNFLLKELVNREPSHEIFLTCAACPGFVEFVERGDLESEQVHILAERLLKPLIDEKVDTLLLGCTHYPFLARTIADVMGSEVVLVSSAEETAFEVRDLLVREKINSGRSSIEGHFTSSSRSKVASSSTLSAENGTQTFLSSGDVELFRTLGTRLLEMEIPRVFQVTW